MFDAVKNIGFKKLSHLYKILQYKSISEASLQMGISKQVLYQDIEVIEKNVGTPLLIKDRNDVILTQKGKELMPFIRQVAELTALTDLPGEKTERKADLSIACEQKFSFYVLPYALEMYQKQHDHPLVVVSSYYADNAPNIYEYDIVISDNLPHYPDATYHPLCTLSFGLYAAPEYVKNAPPPKAFEDLKDHALIDYSVQPVFGFHKELQKAIMVESDSYVNLNDLCAQGLGVAPLCIQEVERNRRYQHLVRLLPERIMHERIIELGYFTASAKQRLIQEIVQGCLDHQNYYGVAE